MKKFLLLAVLALSACATVEVGVVTSENTGEDLGIRYYPCGTFVLVYSDGQGGINYQILTLPDLAREMYAKPSSIIAKNDVELTFENGCLSESKAVADATAFPVAVIEAIKGAVGATFDGVDERPWRGFPSPALYRVVVTQNGIELRGGHYALTPDGTSESVIAVPVFSSTKTEGKK